MIEPDYYSFARAAEIIACPQDILIRLASEDKLPIYVDLVGVEVEEFEVCDDEGGGYVIDEYYITETCQLWSTDIKRYRINPNVSIYSILPSSPVSHYYKLKNPIPLKGLPKLVSALDVARLLKIEKSTNKELNYKSKIEKRLINLKEFIDLLSNQAKANEIEFDPMGLPLTKEQLLNELKNRHPSNFRIEIDSFETVWSAATKAGICASRNANEKNGKEFLKKIYK